MRGLSGTRTMKRTDATRPAAQPTAGPDKPKEKEGHRETVEAIVVAMILALLVRGFEAEAFVIPTGSMATTLLGYHRNVVCGQCSYPFLVNASPETEENMPVVSCNCPNCGYKNVLRPGGGLP